MKRLITSDDLIESYAKILQKGPQLFLRKLNISGKARTISTFQYSENTSSNYWNIPEVKHRWNLKITGNKEVSYEQYVLNNYLNGKSGLTMLSPGSGISSHEMQFASSGCFREITCMDISYSMMRKAKALAMENDFHTMKFITGDFQSAKLPDNYYDVILFHSSLHHFRNLHTLLPGLNNSLKKDGIIIINEYAGPRRIIYNRQQLQAINSVLQTIPPSYRRRLKSGILKKQVTGPGYLRMLITDPSEAIESDIIRPLMHKHYKPLEEKDLGGNIIMLLFKDIAHNFTDGSKETKEIIERIFKAEDEYLKKYRSDFIFGVYKKKG